MEHVVYKELSLASKKAANGYTPYHKINKLGMYIREEMKLGQYVRIMTLMH